MKGGRMRGAVAHDVSQASRTLDVVLPDSTTFADLLLSQRTLSGLHAAGFCRPSPIQRSAIPLGRCGTDLIVQAKSGTGKTLVFGIIALEMLDVTIPQLQVLILAPTREIAVQIKEVLTSIAVGHPGLKLAAFIGGLAVSADVAAAKLCHVAVGTPGRVKQLVTDGSLPLRAVRLFVLDEADQLVEKSFKKDVNFIFSKLPESKQSLVVSATFPPKMEEFLARYLVHPRRVNPTADILLLGLRQFVAVTRTHTSALVRLRNKTSRLLQILSSLSFRQCLVFCNLQSRMEAICKDLACQGWPALHLAGSMPQPERLAAVAALQNQRCRVLLTTDLAARGVDAEQVDLVVNLDLPYDTETYLHRIGRAGRFGAPGIAVSVVDDTSELTKLRYILFDVGGPDFKVPRLPDGDFNPDTWTNDAALDLVDNLPRIPETNGHETEVDSVEDNEPSRSKPSTSKSKKIITEPERAVMSKNEAVEILRAQFIKLPKITPLTYAELIELFHTKKVPEKEPPAASKVVTELEEGQLEMALKCLRIGEGQEVASGCTSDSFESSSSGQESDFSEHSTEGISKEWDDSTVESETEYAESENWNCKGSDDSSSTENSSDSGSDHESMEPSAETNCGDRCQFAVWRDQLLARRQALQRQLYLKEMLK